MLAVSRKLSRRASLSVLDQGVSSLGNFALSVFVASSVGVQEFGLYAIIFAVAWMTQGLVRAALLEPLLILRSRLINDIPRLDSQVLVISTFVSVPIGLLCVFPGLLFDQVAFYVIAVLLTPIILQDCVRFISYSKRDPGMALYADLTMTGLLICCGVLLKVLANPALVTWLTLWGSTAMVATLLVGQRLDALPKKWLRVTWPRYARDASKDLVFAYGATVGTAQLVTFLLPYFGSLATLGGLKAAEVVSAPVRLLVVASSLVGMPAVAQRAEVKQWEDIGRLMNGLGLTMMTLGLAWGVMCYLVPPSLGHSVLGDSWDLGSELAPFVAAQWGFFGVLAAGSIGLRAISDTRTNLLCRLAVAPVQVIVPLGLLKVYGVNGLKVGLLVSAGVSSILFMAVLTTKLRARNERMDEITSGND